MIDPPIGVKRNRDAEEQKVKCMWRASHSGMGGELTVVTYSDEGDPTTTYYRAEPDVRRLRVYVDSTADSFACFRAWSMDRCRSQVGVVSGNLSCI
jgi:hypothetical protein